MIGNLLSIIRIWNSHITGGHVMWASARLWNLFVSSCFYHDCSMGGPLPDIPPLLGHKGGHNGDEAKWKCILVITG